MQVSSTLLARNRYDGARTMKETRIKSVRVDRKEERKRCCHETFTQPLRHVQRKMEGGGGYVSRSWIVALPRSRLVKKITATMRLTYIVSTLFSFFSKKSSKLEEVKKLIKNFEQTCFRMLLESNESFAIIQVQLYSSKLDRFNESSLRATRGHAPFRPPSMNARMLLSPFLCRPYSSQARRYLLIERELEGGKRSRGAKNRSLKRRGAL